MHLQFIKDLVTICAKKHLRFADRVLLIKTFINLKTLHRKVVTHDTSNPIQLLQYKVYTDNFADFYATFYEIFIKEEYFFKSIESAELIIDAGANIGLATLYFKWRNPKVNIIGFEMNEDTYHFYQLNVSENKLDNVELYNVAVGKEVGEMKSFGTRRASTINPSLAKKLPEKTEPEKVSTVKVDVLSRYIPNNIKTVLKMDIEGAEIDVIEELYKSDRLTDLSQIIFEFHYSENLFFEKIEHLLKSRNFKVIKRKRQKNGHFIAVASNIS